MGNIDHKICVDGSNIFYWTFGEKGKETLIFLHGWPGTSLIKSKLTKELSKYYYVIAPELPGFLRSDALLKYTNAFEQSADVVFEILKRENLDAKKHILIGQSYGGVIASFFAEKYPKNIKVLVLSNSVMATKDQDLVRKFFWYYGYLVIRLFLYLPNRMKKGGLKALFGLVTKSKDPKYNNVLIRARVPMIDNSTRLFRESVGRDGNLLDREYGDFPIIMSWGDKDGKRLDFQGYCPIEDAKKIFLKLKNKGKNIKFLELKGGHGILYQKPEYVVGEIRKAILEN